MAINCWSNLGLLRALLALIFVIATIILYALYSTTTMLTPSILIPYVKSASFSVQQQRMAALLPMLGLKRSGEKAADLLANSSLYANASSMSGIKRFPKAGDDLQQSEFVAKPTKASSKLVNPSIETGLFYESGHFGQFDTERICPLNGSTTLLLILITSELSHADARMSIRSTWGDYGKRGDIGIAFVVGRSFNVTVNQALSKENLMYNDLIRRNFIDSSSNLTLKLVSALEWSDQHCHHAKYILKADDQSFINVPKLLNFVKQLEKHKEKRTIFGRIIKKEKPDRNMKSTDIDQFTTVSNNSVAMGGVYLLTGDIVHDLYVRSLKTIYLPNADAFITDIVAQSLEIDRLHVYEFVNGQIDLTPCNIQHAISIHMIKPEQQQELWQKLFEPIIKCKNNLRFL